MRIRNAEELHKLLSKAQQIESEYETLAEWEGYISLDSPKYRDLLFELISDSEKHSIWVKEMLGMVILPEGYRAPELPPASFDFRGRSEFDTLMELERYEQLTLDLYSAIMGALGRSELKGVVMEDNLDRMLKFLDDLVSDETRHRDAVRALVGQVKLIR
jgi:rubrerythrin